MKGLFAIILFFCFFTSCKKDTKTIEIADEYDFRDTLVGVFTGTMTNSSTWLNPTTGPSTSTSTTSISLVCEKEGDFPSTKVKIDSEIFELSSSGTYSSTTGSGSSMTNCSIKITQHNLIFSKGSACGVMCYNGHSFNGTK